MSDSVTYIIEITPTESGLERHITAFREGSDSSSTHAGPRLSGEDADRLERIYGMRPDTVAVFEAQGRFDTIPNDIGNWGMMRRFQSRLGTAWFYAERVRGDVDPLEGLEHVLGAADSAASIVLGWAKAEVGQHPGWPALRSFIDRDLRRDLRNHSVMVWRLDPMPLDGLEVALLEHRALLGLLSMGIAEDDEARIVAGVTLAELRSMVAGVMGLDARAEKEETLRFLSSPETARESLIRYISGETGETPEAAAGRWDRVKEAALVGRSSMLEESPGTDSLVLHLSVPAGCVGLETNGAWDEETRRVVWSGRIQAPGDSRAIAPFACFAVWAIPDSANQRRLFGKVSLSDEKLIEYCVWFAYLDATHQAEWNRMIAQLRPRKRKPLERFEFSSEKGQGQGKAGDIPGRRMVLDAFR